MKYRKETGALHILLIFFLLLCFAAVAFVAYQFSEVRRLRSDVEKLKSHIATLEARFAGELVRSA